MTVPELPIMQQHMLPTEVLALSASGPRDLLQDSQEILTALLGEDEAQEVELLDDPEWKEYPEIGEALKEAGGDETSLCLAISPMRSIWAVGVAGKGKVREPVARLALCVALAADADPETFGEWAAKSPPFLHLCQLAGRIPLGFEQSASERYQEESSERYKEESSDALPPTAKRRFTGFTTKETAAKPAVAASWQPPTPAAASMTLPRDRPFLIQLAKDSEVPVVLDGLLAEAVAISTEGTKRKGLYSHVDQAIGPLLLELGVPEEELQKAVEYKDDANWSQFPSVGAALKAIAPAEECLCVAVCASVGVWAVGVGMKGKARYSAAKAAILGSLALAAEEAGSEVDFSEELPSIAEYIEEVKAARAEFFSEVDA